MFNSTVGGLIRGSKEVSRDIAELEGDAEDFLKVPSEISV